MFQVFSIDKRVSGHMVKTELAIGEEQFPCKKACGFVISNMLSHGVFGERPSKWNISTELESTPKFSREVGHYKLRNICTVPRLCHRPELKRFQCWSYTPPMDVSSTHFKTPLDEVSQYTLKYPFIFGTFVSPFSKQILT